MSAVHRAILFALAAGLGWLGFGAAFSQNAESEKRTAPARTNKPAETIGMAGCAATGCHGRTNVRHGTLDADTWHESFALWIDRDPHTRSYTVLNGQLAKNIMKNLRHGDRSLPEDAMRDLRCLACHTNPSLAKPLDDASGQLQRIRAEGVSCEACHGNAEKWQIAHTNPIPPAERGKLLGEWQMNDLNDWSVQAKTCAGCHIGAGADPDRGLPVRDMNHDMIAAGHPRLEFDFPAYQAKLSKHWMPRNRTTGQPPAADDRLQAWVHGQIAVEDAYCDLSQDRMARANADPRSPYPEFADWNCSGCHHRIESAPWRERAAKAQAGVKPENRIHELGRPMWIGGSNFLPALPIPKFGDVRKSQVTTLQERKKRLAVHAGEIAKNPAEARRIVGDLLAVPSGSPASWEEAARAYLGLRSLEECLRAAGGVSSNESLAKLADARKALWGSSAEPGRKEHAAKDYQRKPESRWRWEDKPDLRPDTFDATIQQLKASLASDLKKLPPTASKP